MNFKKIKQYLDQPIVFAVVLVVIIILVAAVLAQVKKVSQQIGLQASKATDELQTDQPQADAAVNGLQAGEHSTDSLPGADGDLLSDAEADGHLVTMKKTDGVAVPAGNRVKFKIALFQKLAVQPLKFNIYDEKGAEIKPDYLKIEHEQKVHFILASANLKEYQHLHPEYKNGVWNVSANMPTPGTYYAYVNIVPIKGGPVVLRSDLIVREPTKGEIKYPGLTPDLFAITDGYKAQLEINGAETLDEKRLTFALTRDGAAVSDIKPYLGAFGHVILLRHGTPDTLVHLHPYFTTDETKGSLVFWAHVSKPGRYTAFAEFKINERIRLFPLTFDVE